MTSNLKLQSIKLTVQAISSSNNDARFSRRIYLHVETMREHKLWTGDHVIIRKEIDGLEWQNASNEV
jgi:hypothetical protein